MSNDTRTILCVGHAAYDVYLPVDGYPAEDTKCECACVTECTGGPSCNAALLCSKWQRERAREIEGERETVLERERGACGSCGLACQIGVDATGDKIMSDLEQSGVSPLVSSEGGSPLSTIIVNTKNGTRTIVTHKPSKAPLSLEGERDYIERLHPDVVLFDGHELQASLQVLEWCPYALSILDAGSLREGTRVLAPLVDVLAVSTRFCSSYLGLGSLADPSLRGNAHSVSSSDIECVSYLDIMAALHDGERERGVQNGEGETLLQNGERETVGERGGGLVVVTMGDRGCIARIGDDGASYHLDAPQVSAVDTTGAGDIFHGALAYTLPLSLRRGCMHSGKDSEASMERGVLSALKVASASGALCCTGMGGSLSIPSLADSVSLAQSMEEWRRLDQ
ncbi:hypothetical protein KIPB_006572 [Kipferlia bialata]|uniref:Carbohydrate kinase PfkB domain-containing protein n=1 Tax=Kipferlia bialata TaxID=797122 RepID=A0A9K3GJ74_9EUKA|nr:hypothetical protein KIPB_006572 [Kipferlia bialata]|eukprot:g6572.t1